MNAPIKDALTELQLLPLFPLPPFTLLPPGLIPLLLSLVFASSRFGPLHLSVEQQVVYKKMNNIPLLANTIPTQVRNKFG